MYGIIIFVVVEFLHFADTFVHMSIYMCECVFRNFNLYKCYITLDFLTQIKVIDCTQFNACFSLYLYTKKSVFIYTIIYIYVYL